MQQRRGYSIERRGGRFDVFARVVARRILRRTPGDTAVLEIWNGVPFLSPLWAGRRRVVWVHHLHRHMWADVLPGPLAAVGRFMESRLAPPLYARTRVATLSDSSAAELGGVGLRRLTVIPPGIDERFTPDPGRRTGHPSLVVVGRLAPVKRQRAALDAAEVARRDHPGLTVEVIGDGPDRPLVEAWIDEHGANDWVRLRGFVDDAQLVEAYRSAWLVVSASKAEGWGMSLTEAAACGTPAVATDIAGHRGSAIHGETGVLVADLGRLGEEIATLLGDDTRRHAMGAAATAHAVHFTWDDVAARHLELLVEAVELSTSSRVRSDRRKISHPDVPSPG
ncbi:MAG: glycosyltransferase family 4 protein [Actinomycetota bacterium]